jgi:hypothetical protein
MDFQGIEEGGGWGEHVIRLHRTEIILSSDSVYEDSMPDLSEILKTGSGKGAAILARGANRKIKRSQPCISHGGF